MNNSLEIKLEKIKKLNYKPKDFIIADAKDADMAMGIITPGPERDNRGKILKTYKKLNDYLFLILILQFINTLNFYFFTYIQYTLFHFNIF